MDVDGIAGWRLGNQRLVGTPFDRPEDVVRWLGAVQAQDYPGAKWAIAQRLAATTSAALDRCFDEGRILRTHVLRPTWHFVLPTEIRWMLALTAPRVNVANASAYRQLELDEATCARSQAILTDALRDGKHLTRPELGAALAAGGISTDSRRLAFLLMRAELDALICSGPRRGKHFTYALLDERVPRAAALAPEEALVELTRRYFTSHGPATPHDFAWWSGLTLADVRRGIALAGEALAQERIGEATYWFGAGSAPTAHPPTLHLLPNYDEHLVAYRDHRPSFAGRVWASTDGAGDLLFAHTIVRNGHVAGIWRRTIGGSRATVAPRWIRPPDDDALAALASGIERYSRFLELPVTLVEAPETSLTPEPAPAR